MFTLRLHLIPSYCAFVWLLAGLVTALGGCERLRSYTDVEYLQRAKELKTKESFPAAIIELKNALQKNPKNAEARWLLGEVYANTGLGKEAEKELKLAVD